MSRRCKLKKKSNYKAKKQSANFSNQITQFIQLATNEILKKNNYPPREKCSLVAIDMFVDNKRRNMYSTGIFVKQSQTKEDAQKVTQKLLEETSIIVNAVLDKDPKSMDDARKMLSELVKEG